MTKQIQFALEMGKTRTREVAPCIKGFAIKCEDLSLGTQHVWKTMGQSRMPGK